MAWTAAEEARVAALESLVDTMMQTVEELATKLMLNQSTLILDKDIQDLQTTAAELQAAVLELQGYHS
ncbi:MAG: hypothetical protein KAR39_11670 [Thermoplasmata archaeon]|nr:hypothetical protein [Thermoplasmata archaeon]